MNASNWINIDELPRSEDRFSELYCDYLYRYQRVQQYYEFDFHNLHLLSKYAEMLSEKMRERTVLTEVLAEQNREFGAHEKALENISSLADSKTFAVVTGQQVGILGGPLYTFYKTITAIKLARKLSNELPQYKFVPVFWLEGEDHDFEEINKVGLLNPDNVPVKAEYLIGGKPLLKNVGAAGEIVFDSSLEAFFEQIQKSLSNSEFKKPLIEMLQESYRTGTTFNKAFASLLGRFFSREGLVFISSNDKRLKKILSPIFQKEIREYPRVSQLIIEESANLEERYHAQIKTKALNLFMFFKGGRYFIEPREQDFSLKGTRNFIPKEELLRMAAEEPELFSPNVALRPICQDAILPTAVYVAGPSEIAYFAQLKRVYDNFNMTMPMIYPRASATIVEEKMERILEKYELDITQLFGGESERVKRKVIDMVSEVKIEEMFSDALQRINGYMNEMKFGVNYIDATLLGALENTRAKLESHLVALKEKVSEAQKKKHEIALRQIEKVINSLFPMGNFQERELSIIHFINKHGFELPGFLLAELEIDQFKHQIIRL